VIQQMILIG